MPTAINLQTKEANEILRDGWRIAEAGRKDRRKVYLRLMDKWYRNGGVMERSCYVPWFLYPRDWTTALRMREKKQNSNLGHRKPLFYGAKKEYVTKEEGEGE